MWPPDSVLFRVLRQTARSRLAELIDIARGEWLPPIAFRNLVQLLACTEGGDAVLRRGDVRLEGARLTGVRFADLNLEAVSFRGCDLTNAEFRRCSLRGADVERASLQNTKFVKLQRGALAGAKFGGGEHFDSVIVDDGRRIEDLDEFAEWLGKETGKGRPAVSVCPSRLQLLHLFRKFVHVDGQGRRDWLDPRAVTRGRQVGGAPPYERFARAAIEYGFLVEDPRAGQIRRGGNPLYGQMVSFVKTGALSDTIRSLLDSLCRLPGCAHAGAS
jgi:hypothetical protein